MKTKFHKIEQLYIIIFIISFQLQAFSQQKLQNKTILTAQNALHKAIYKNINDVVSEIDNIENTNIITTKLGQNNKYEAWESIGIFSGTDGPILDFAVMNGQLYVAGAFTYINGKEVNSIARWNGTEWEDLMGGLNGVVNCLLVYNNKLYVGGHFISANSNNITISPYIAVWDGSQWAPVGNGFNNTVYALTVFQNQLYAAGAFTQSGNIAINKLAKWDGSQWNPVIGPNNQPVHFSGLNGAHINCMKVFNGELYIGGVFDSINNIPFNNVAKWNGMQWNSLGSGTSGMINTMEIFNNELYLGGKFLQAGGNNVKNIAKWDSNAWSVLGDELYLENNFSIEKLYAYNNQLLVGYLNQNNDSSGLTRILSWNGSSWATIDGNFKGFNTNSTYHNPYISSFIAFDNQLVIGGIFESVDSLKVNNLVVYNDTTYTYIGQTNGVFLSTINEIRAMVVYQNELYVAGSFKISGKHYALAKWNGNEWISVLLFDDIFSWPQTMIVYNGELYIGGGFTQISGEPMKGIARWNGQTWNPVGQGVDGWVRSLCVYNNELYIGGKFSSAGGLNVENIVKWNGNSYQHVPTNGINFSESFSGITAMCVYNGALIIGGDMNPFIAKFNGNNWTSVGNYYFSAHNININDMEVFQNELYVGGNNLYNPSTGSTSGLLKWNGSHWSLVGNTSNETVSSTVNAIEIYHGELYIGGYFETVGSLNVNRIARWNGYNWNVLGTESINGISTTSSDYFPNVSALCTFDDKLYVAGKFTHAGNVSANNIAAWFSDGFYSVEESSLNNQIIQVYPNPSNGTFTITTNKNGGVFELMDITGRIINTYPINTNTYTITETLSAGLYFIKEKRSDAVKKLIIKSK